MFVKLFAQILQWRKQWQQLLLSRSKQINNAWVIWFYVNASNIRAELFNMTTLLFIKHFPSLLMFICDTLYIVICGKLIGNVNQIMPISLKS